jgi:hypothetical protein
MRRQLVLATLALIAGAGTGFAADEATPAAAAPAAAPAAPATRGNGTPVPDRFVIPSGLFTKFYGECTFEGRIYVFGTQPAMDKFEKTHDFDVTHGKSYIGAGPQRQTVRTQVDADSPTLEHRIYQQFKDRYGL